MHEYVVYIATKTPNLSGKYECSGKRLTDSNTVILDWEATIEIKQEGNKMGIIQRDDTDYADGSPKFSSESVVAWLKTATDGRVELKYLYKANGKQSYEGVMNLTFTKDLQTANGTYYTDNVGNRHGIINWKKII